MSRARKCACKIARDTRTGIPAQFHQAQIEDFTLNIVESASAWIDRPGDGAFISGVAGVGKTHLLAALAIRINLQHEGRWVRFLRASDFYRDVRRAMASDAGETDLLALFCDVRVLAIDDLGAGGLSDFERRTVLDVIDRRINDRLPTAVTSNWTLGDIAERIDDRLASRLAGFTQIRLEGVDRRLA